MTITKSKVKDNRTLSGTAIFNTQEGIRSLVKVRLVISALAAVLLTSLFINSDVFGGMKPTEDHSRLVENDIKQSVAYNGANFDGRDHPGQVIVSIAQLGDPFQQIANGCVEVKSLLGSGTDPHLYRLTRADVLKMHNADSVLYMGHLLEAQMEPVLNDMSRHKPVIALVDNMPSEMLMEVAKDNYDPHLWMDPVLWGQTLSKASEITAKVFPECEEEITRGLSDYLDQLDAFHLDVAARFAAVPAEQRVLVTSHDAFGYFGQRYGIKVMAIQGISTDRQISLRKLNNLVDYIVENDLRVVFTETSVNPRDIKALVAGARSRGHEVTIGGSLYSDSMGRTGTKEGTYLGMLEHNIDTILMAWEQAQRYQQARTTELTADSLH